MSHYWKIRCPKCDEESRSYNHGVALLVQAIVDVQPLRSLKNSGWSVEGAVYRDSVEVGAFILEHESHAPLEVVGEYASDPVITIGPKPRPSTT